jgi:hypothetical protein
MEQKERKIKGGMKKLGCVLSFVLSSLCELICSFGNFEYQIIMFLNYRDLIKPSSLLTCIGLFTFRSCAHKMPVAYVSFSKPVSIPPQNLSDTKHERKGFTLVERGGSEVVFDLKAY